MGASMFPVPLSGIQTTTLTTTGDMIYATAANTAARLGIGSSAQVLTVASGVPSWATASSGSMTLMLSGTLTGATPSITGITSGYNHLELWVQDYYGSGANVINMRINSNTGAVYNRQLVLSSLSPTVSGTSGATSMTTNNGIITSSNQNGWMQVKFPFYSLTSTAKMFQFFWCRSGGSDAAEQIWGNINDTNAVSSIQFFLDGGSTFTGGDYLLYGVK